jgi:hypothetical protein
VVGDNVVMRIDARDRRVRTWVAAVADALVVVVFVAIGRRTHHSGGDVEGFFGVLWPFAAGLVVGWLATGLARAPLSLRRAAGAWVITVVIGVALRIVVQGHEWKPTFAIVALLFFGAAMLGWRAVVLARVASRR